MWLLASLCLPYVSLWLPLDGFLWNLMLQTSMKICQENPDLIKIQQKYWTVYVKIEVCFTFAVDINSPQNHCVWVEWYQGAGIAERVETLCECATMLYVHCRSFACWAFVNFMLLISCTFLHLLYQQKMHSIKYNSWQILNSFTFWHLVAILRDSTVTKEYMSNTVI